ncbi:hypothetical protein ACNQFN_11445 [Thauera butanivorans]|uniref:hypothetical protein n=1 Tax=Thauera butanivorans TaxID=86174 RepID=UPI003AB4D064
MTPRDWMGDLLGLLVLLSGVGACGWIGYQVGRSDVDELRAQYAREHAAAAEHASRKLLAATKRGDRLTLELAAAQLDANRLSQEVRDEIPRVTDDRACLREPALRLLDSATGLSVRLPAPARVADAADAGRVATDADISNWAVDAGAQYAECARRLAALIDWHQATHEETQ